MLFFWLCGCIPAEFMICLKIARIPMRVLSLAGSRRVSKTLTSLPENACAAMCKPGGQIFKPTEMLYVSNKFLQVTLNCLNRYAFPIR